MGRPVAPSVSPLWQQRPMAAASEEMSPQVAARIFDSAELFDEWFEDSEFFPNRGAACGFLITRSLEITAAPPPPSPHRFDATELRAYVSRAPGLPLRLREVARLCLDEGLTLDACATRLGIARETVRVHLRRLRHLQRRAGRAA